MTAGRRDLRLASLALWAALAVGLGLLGWRVLTGCAVAWPGGGAAILSYCPPPPEPDPRLAELARETERRRALEDELARLRLALVDAPACEVPEEPEEPEEEIAEEEPPPEPPPEEDPPDLAEEPPAEEPVEVAELPPEPVPPEPVRVPERRPTPPPPPPEPEPEPPPPEPQPVQPPPGPVEQCDTNVSAAGRHNDRRVVNLGTDPGRVTIEYNHFRVPDRIEVWYHGLLLASTPGMVSGSSRISFNWQPQFNDPYVEVVVVANPRYRTRWIYRVNCPR